MLLFAIIALAAGLAQAPGGPRADWREELERGRQACSTQDYAAAAAALAAAAELASQAPDGRAGLLESLRMLAGVHRLQGDYTQAEQVLARAVGQFAAAAGDIDLADILADLAAAQRAQGHSGPALASLERAIRIREALPQIRREDLARDLTAAAVLRLESGAADQAMEALERAVSEWGQTAPGDPRSLPALEALAIAYRDRSQYAEAEPLLLRALHLRQATGAPDSAEVIAVVDSLAYVEFGLKKMPEAERLYERLLALWEKNAGPEHPMVALTLDKMAEFYAFQERYTEAETFARRALALRTRTHVASLNQTGRLLLMQARLPEAEDLYRRTIRIGDLAEAPDEALDPPLRIYAQVLRALNRPDEAARQETRVKDALLRKAEREGRRPSPLKPSPSPPGK